MDTCLRLGVFKYSSLQLLHNQRTTCEDFWVSSDYAFGILASFWKEGRNCIPTLMMRDGGECKDRNRCSETRNEGRGHEGTGGGGSGGGAGGVGRYWKGEFELRKKKRGKTKGGVKGKEKQKCQGG